jgi:hypothetical protein
MISSGKINNKFIKMEEINWYCNKIGKKFDEFDVFDRYITDVLKEFVKERLEAINYTHCCEEFADGKCRPMVNAEWTYLRCECGKRFMPKG